MTLVDDRGRVFGRWNVVDALVGLVLLGLIPLLYGGYVLFRPQAASLVAIEPARIQAPGELDITIRGNNLRPYMRVSFDGVQGRNFLFSDATRAVVRVSDIPPGVYDVVLYDNAQERARLPKALEVVAAPRAQTEVDVIGKFTAIPEPLAAQIKADLQIAGLGRVTRVGAAQPSSTRVQVGAGDTLNLASASAVNVPAVIRAGCTLVPRGGTISCMALDNNLAPDIVLTLPLAGANAIFQIDQVRSTAATTPLEVRARFTGDRPILERIQRGDRDVERKNEFASGAEISSVSAVTRAGSSVIVATQAPGVPPTIVAGDIATADAVLRVPAQQAAEGWSYRGQPLTPGRVFMFRGPGYEVSVTILSVAAK